jgi:hypothetical protein
MIPVSRAFLSGLLSVAVPACSTSVQARSDAITAQALTTDSVEYVARSARASSPASYSFRIIARFENRTDKSVFLGRCYPNSPGPVYGLESLDAPHTDTNPQSGAAYSPMWACVGHDRQIEVLPTATRTDTLRISGPNTWDGRTQQPFGVLEGRFRLLYFVRLCPGDMPCAVADHMEYSNVFMVRLSH